MKKLLVTFFIFISSFTHAEELQRVLNDKFELKYFHMAEIYYRMLGLPKDRAITSIDFKAEAPNTLLVEVEYKGFIDQAVKKRVTDWFEYNAAAIMDKIEIEKYKISVLFQEYKEEN